MVDLHNHILPGIDDGAASLDAALAMARQAVACGTDTLAATPHRFFGEGEITRDTVTEGVLRLQRYLHEQGVDLRLVVGQELTMKPDVPAGLADGRLLPLGGYGGRCVLIEPPFDGLPETSLSLLESVQRLGLTPLIAHPERNPVIQQDLTFVKACIARGIFFQVTTSSIIGSFGVRPERTARAIVENHGGKVLIASDAHNSDNRTPGDMLTAVEIVAQWIGDRKAACAMADDIPRRLLGN